MPEKLARSSYRTENIGDSPAEMNVNGRKYVKLTDLRYGTNPHQPAAAYRPADACGAIMDMKVLKTGKNGLSQTNFEDISGALNIVKYFSAPACAVMKHVNPSGAAVAVDGETLKDVYVKARDCDARAAFGSGRARPWLRPTAAASSGVQRHAPEHRYAAGLPDDNPHHVRNGSVLEHKYSTVAYNGAVAYEFPFSVGAHPP